MEGGGTPQLETRQEDQAPYITGLSLDYLSVTYTLKPSSKSFAESIHQIYSLLFQYRANIIDSVVMEPEYSPNSHYRGPCLSGGGISIYTQSQSERRKPRRAVLLEIHGTGCRQLGSDGKILTVINRLQELLPITNPLPSRLDIALDIVNFPVSRRTIKRFSCLLRHIRLSPNQDEPTGATWGNSKNCQIVIYDKALELSKNGKSIADIYPQLLAGSPLTRIEARLKRSWLREKGYNDVERIVSCKGGIMRNIMEYTLKHRGRNGKASRKWLNLMDQLDQKKPLPEPKIVVPINIGRECLVVCGCLARLAVGLKIKDPHEALATALSYVQECGKGFEGLLKAKAEDLKNRSRALI